MCGELWNKHIGYAEWNAELNHCYPCTYTFLYLCANKLVERVFTIYHKYSASPI